MSFNHSPRNFTTASSDQHFTPAHTDASLLAEIIPTDAWVSRRSACAEQFKTFLSAVVGTRLGLPDSHVHIVPSMVASYIDPVVLVVSVESMASSLFGDDGPKDAPGNLQFTQTLAATLKNILSTGDIASPSSTRAPPLPRVRCKLQPTDGRLSDILWPATALSSKVSDQVHEEEDDFSSILQRRATEFQQLPAAAARDVEIAVDPLRLSSSVDPCGHIPADIKNDNNPCWALFVPFAPTLDARLLLDRCGRAVEVRTRPQEQGGGWTVHFQCEEDLLWTFGGGVHSGLDFSSPQHRRRGSASAVEEPPLSPVRWSVDSLWDDELHSPIREDMPESTSSSQWSPTSLSQSSRHRSRIEAQLVCCERTLHPQHNVHPMLEVPYRVVVRCLNKTSDAEKVSDEEHIPLWTRRRVLLGRMVCAWTKAACRQDDGQCTVGAAQNVLLKLVHVLHAWCAIKQSSGSRGLRGALENASCQLTVDVVCIMAAFAIERLGLVRELHALGLMGSTNHHCARQLPSTSSIEDETVLYVLRRVVVFYTEGANGALSKKAPLTGRAEMQGSHFIWGRDSIDLSSVVMVAETTSPCRPGASLLPSVNASIECGDHNSLVIYVGRKEACLMRLAWDSRDVADLFLFFQNMSHILIPGFAKHLQCRRRMLRMVMTVNRGFSMCSTELCRRVADATNDEEGAGVSVLRPGLCQRCLATFVLNERNAATLRRECIANGLLLAAEQGMHLTAQALSMVSPQVAGK